MITEQAAQFYALSAAHLDRAYAHPDRQADLADLRARLRELLAGHIVLELACGSGYWTEAVAGVAEAVVATDINPELLALAAQRGLPANVTLRQVDALTLPEDIGEYTAVLAAGWWAHVRREEQDRYLAHLRAQLGKDILLVLIDDSFVDGFSETSSVSIARTDAEGNTYQIRTAPNGERYELVKNYPSDSALRKKLAHAVREIRILRSDHYWLLSCRLK